jgi:glycogen debranching enzyme
MRIDAMTGEPLLRVYPDLLFAYHAHSLLISDRGGAISQGLEGLYEHDTRILSRYRLLVHGGPLRLDSLSAVDAYSTLAYYVSPPTADGAVHTDALGLAVQEQDRQITIRVARFVGQGLHEDVELTNYGQSDVSLELAWELAADFADLIEVRGNRRQQEAPVTAHWQITPGGDGELRFEYQHPELQRGVVLRFHAPGRVPRWDEERVCYSLQLGPHESCRCCLTIAPVRGGRVQEPVYGCDAFGALATKADEVRRTWTQGATRIQTRNWKVQRAWDRAVADLGALALGDGATDAELAVPAAGQPLYGTLFGRDASTAAGQSLIASPVLAEGALRLLARHLGSRDDPFYDEQPGRVPQQVRDDPLALLGLTPWLHDYGDYAAPCAFLVLLGGHHLVVGNAAFTRELLDPARRVLDWLDERADLDGDGFLEYKTRSSKGQKHQGWKDSGNAVVYEDGRQVEPPLAPCEIQGYWYAAQLLMAEVFLALGEPSRAFGLFRQAEDLKRRFNERFWMPDERFIAFALDAEKRQVKSVASNAGHCLATGIVDKRHAADFVRRVMAADMFSGWGIRTLSADHPAYNPFSYHLGSVWPVENATTAFGMKRYGFAAECNRVAQGIFDAAALFEHHRLPEAFGGHPRDARHPHPGIYPDACAPQAWSASAVFWLVQAMLGLWSYAPLNVLIIEPELPPWLPELTIRQLRIGDARISIQFKRDASGRTDYRVLKREGRIRVLRQPPPEDLHARPVTRLRELVESLLPGH